MGATIEHLENIKRFGLPKRQEEYYNFVIERGRLFTGENAAKDYEYDGDVRQRQCYRNSLIAALVIDDLEYYEGFYICQPIPLPLEHAFNLCGERLIDLTAGKFKFDVTEWFGVHVPKSVLWEYLETEQYETALVFYFKVLSGQK